MLVPCTATLCGFDKSLTFPVFLFEIFIFAASIAILYLIRRLQKKTFIRYAIMMTGVFLFELFTAPMWNNDHLGKLAYIYIDVSWVLTIGWTTLFYYIVFVVDYYGKKRSQLDRFIWYVMLLTPIVLLFESAVVKLGVRSYAPEVYEAAGRATIPFLDIPLAGLYYIPVFITLVISFFKYWSLYLDKKLLVPVKKIRWLRNFLLSFAGVLLFELMIEPMVRNVGLPAGSYLYRDISVIMSGFWILLIALSVHIVDTVFIHWSLPKKFIGYLAIAGTIAIPFEAWFINSGMRVYTVSATQNFTGFKTLLFHVPVEVVMAIPFYLALIIAFIKFWELVADNKNQNL